MTKRIRGRRSTLLTDENFKAVDEALRKQLRERLRKYVDMQVLLDDAAADSIGTLRRIVRDLKVPLWVIDDVFHGRPSTNKLCLNTLLHWTMRLGISIKFDFKEEAVNAESSR